MPSDHLILCCPLLLLPSIFPASESSNTLNIPPLVDIIITMIAGPSKYVIISYQPRVHQRHKHIKSEMKMSGFYNICLPSSIFPSIGVFPDESALHITWPKYWNFSFSTGPSNEGRWTSNLITGGVSHHFCHTHGPCAPSKGGLRSVYALKGRNLGTTVEFCLLAEEDVITHLYTTRRIMCCHGWFHSPATIVMKKRAE